MNSIWQQAIHYRKNQRKDLARYIFSEQCEEVEEVKQSEEWEAVKMNILEIGIQKGERDKLKEIIKKKLEKGKTIDEIADALEEETRTIEELIKEIE